MDMLARFRFLLPFELSVPQGSELKPQEFELAPYRVRIYPPIEVYTTQLR